MPTFDYTGSDTRYYPSLGITAEPGQSVDLDSAPDDGRWSTGGVPVIPAALPPAVDTSGADLSAESQ